MYDNIVEEPSGNSTEFGIAGFLALIAWLTLAGEPTDKIQYTPEQRSTPVVKKCAHQEMAQKYQFTNTVQVLAKE